MSPTLYFLIFFLYIIKKFRRHEIELSVLHFAVRSDKILINYPTAVKTTVLWLIIIPEKIMEVLP